MDEPVRVELPSQQPVLEAVGKGIQAFASIELGLNFCFAAMMEPACRQRSVAAINAIRTFEAKLKMVDAVAAMCLSDWQLSIWINLSHRIRRRKTVRDKLAHWQVSYYPGIRSTKDFQTLKVALVPPSWTNDHNTIMWKGGIGVKSKPLFLKDIIVFSDKAHALTSELLDFSQMAAPRPFEGEGALSRAITISEAATDD